jgi:hypothetical protein
MYRHFSSHQRAWLERLRVEWHNINNDRLGGVMLAPVLQFHESTSKLGSWHTETRTISISLEHFLSAAWGEVVDTLLHEMAHQFAHEVLVAGHERSHGEAFRYAAERLGVSPSASGRPEPDQERKLERIRKLLALAESSNEHEAAAAMATANTLLLRYNLELPSRGAPVGYVNRRIGQPSAAVSLEAKLISTILSQYFFVECIWVSSYAPLRLRDERQLEIMGTESNVEMAHYVHDFLHREVDWLWRQHQAHLTRPSRTARREFCVGVLTGFRAKLQAERTSSAEQGLVWLGDPGLEGHRSARYPRLRSFGSSTGVRETEAMQRGREVGAELVLRRGVAGTSDPLLAPLSLPEGRR